MSGRRRKEMPSGGPPGDGWPQDPAAPGPGGSGDPNPGVRRPPGPPDPYAQGPSAGRGPGAPGESGRTGPGAGHTGLGATGFTASGPGPGGGPVGGQGSGQGGGRNGGRSGDRPGHAGPGGRPSDGPPGYGGPGGGRAGGHPGYDGPGGVPGEGRPRYGGPGGGPPGGVPSDGGPRYGGPGGRPGDGRPGYGGPGSVPGDGHPGYGRPGYGGSGYGGSGGQGGSPWGTGGGAGGPYARGPGGSEGYGPGGYGGSGGRGGPGGGAGGGPGGGPGPSEPSSGGGGRRRSARRRSLSTLIGPLAGAVGLVILLGAGVYGLAESHGCGDDALTLNVAAAPEIAPAIGEVAKSFNDERHSVDGKCVQAKVKPSDPAGMSTVLSGAGSVPGEVDPDVWIPDSSLWVTLVRSTASGASSVHLTGTSVARTPIVVATSRTFATKLHNEGIRPTWDMLLKATDALSPGSVGGSDGLPANSVHLQILDPNRNAGGIGAVVMTRELLQGDPNADPIFTQLVRNVQNSLSPTPQALFASFHRDLHGRAPAVIVPEQAVWKFNHTGPSTPATAMYPSEGLLSLDYPFTLATDDDAKVRGAGLLEHEVNGPKAQAAVRALGFRTPDGRAGDGFTASGLNPRVPRALPTPAAGDVTDVMQAWTKLSLRTRMLTLLDVSGSMAQPVGKGMTRMQATAQVAQGGLAMLPDDTDLGLWTFSTNLNGPLDYREEVPIGPLSTRLGSGTRRQAILAALGRVRPKPTGNTGLYDSVLAAVRSLEKTYRPGYYNSVLVLTDGKNDDVNGISLASLLRTLKQEADPDKPVMVVFIGFGPDVDMSAMQKIAVQTNGEAYHAMKPQDVQRILIETIARRICEPQCR